MQVKQFVVRPPSHVAQVAIQGTQYPVLFKYFPSGQLKHE